MLALIKPSALKQTGGRLRSSSTALELAACAAQKNTGLSRPSRQSESSGLSRQEFGQSFRQSTCTKVACDARDNLLAR
jgi:hypothetical protein